ncbi:MAG: DUF5597 domain-containing protein [Terriglobia bacterium]
MNIPGKNLSLRITFFAAMLLAAGPPALLAGPPIPQIVRTGSRYQLLVDGKPFLILGGQAHNSSATNPEDLDPVWQSLVALHANTAEVPIYWEIIEPKPGQFDFHLIDVILQGARQHHLRLILLWFGTWKWVENTGMAYTPAWIKEDPAKYQRALDATGQPLFNISPFSNAAEEADAQAFAAVMQHIKSVDSSQRTVIMMQVENESGLEGTDRDHSPASNQAYNSPVPGRLMNYLEDHRSRLMPALAAAWAGQGYPTTGTWPQAFGGAAPEAFSAWYVARYIDAVAAAGEKVYPLPMYCNAWPISPGQVRAGDWPSGIPTPHVLDVWKAAAPHIAVLAPDIYSANFQQIAAQYTRANNPLLIVETSFAPSHAPFAFSALAQFNGIGFSPFGIDQAAENGKLNPRAKALADSYEVLEPLLPLIEKYQYTGKLFSVVQGADQAETFTLIPALAAVANFAPALRFGPPPRSATSPAPAGGIIIELAPDDYVVAGYGFRLTFRDLQGPQREPEFLSIEQGTFQGDQWTPERRLNGDEMHVNLMAGARILRVRLVK